MILEWGAGKVAKQRKEEGLNGWSGEMVEQFLREYILLTFPLASSLTKVKVSNAESYFSRQSPDTGQESSFLFANSV